MTRPASSPLLALLACACLFSACIATPGSNTLYTLEPVHQEQMGSEFAGFREMILLMPVRLAPQLQGRALFSQRSPLEARPAARHLWAGPLDQQIAETVTSNLKDLLGTENIAAYPGPRYATVRYQVEIELQEFSGQGPSFHTQAVCTLSDTANKTILFRKTFRETRTIDKPDYSGYVASGSQSLAALSREVAQALRSARKLAASP